MSVLTSYRYGIKEASRRLKLVFLIWVFNFVLAVPAFLLFFSAFGDALGRGRMAADLSSNGVVNAILEFVATSRPAVREIAATAAGLIVLNALASIFINGGILSVLLRPKTGDGFAAAFFAGAGRFFGRFFRLAVYSLALYVPAGLVFIGVQGVLRVVASDPVREQLGFVLFFVRIGLALVLVSFVRMVLDYARIAIVGGNSRDVFQELSDALRFVVFRPVRTLALYYLLAGTGIAALAVYLGVRSTFSEKSPVFILVGFLWAEAFIVSRGWLRVAFQAGQADLFSSAEHPRREHEQRLDEIEHGVDREADQPERQRQQPDEGIEKQGEEGDRPTDYEKQQP